MFSKKLLTLALGVLVLIFGLQSSKAQTLEEILSKHMQALGGEEALKAERNSIADVDIIVPGGLTGKVKNYFKYPD